MAPPPVVSDAISLWRANQLMALSDTAASNGKLLEAMSLVHKANALAPNNEFIQRKIHIVGAAMGDISAITELQTHE